jgi:hypothetical protein
MNFTHNWRIYHYNSAELHVSKSIELGNEGLGNVQVRKTTQASRVGVKMDWILSNRIWIRIRIIVTTDIQIQIFFYRI